MPFTHFLVDSATTQHGRGRRHPDFAVRGPKGSRTCPESQAVESGLERRLADPRTALSGPLRWKRGTQTPAEPRPSQHRPVEPGILWEGLGIRAQAPTASLFPCGVGRVCVAFSVPRSFLAKVWAQPLVTPLCPETLREGPLRPQRPRAWVSAMSSRRLTVRARLKTSYRWEGTDPSISHVPVSSHHQFLLNFPNWSWGAVPHLTWGHGLLEGT